MSEGKEHERQVEEEFDRAMRQELLDEANRLRKEKGLPPLTEDEAGDIENLLG